MKIFRRKKQQRPPPYVERRSSSQENVARRKVFDEHEKKVVDMKAAHIDKMVEDADRRLELIQANLRAIRRNE